MNYLKFSMFGTMLCLLGLGFSDTAVGQITTSPALSSGMSFQVLSGGSQGQQSLTINTPQATTVFITVPAGQTWLKVNGQPASAMFTVNTSQNGALASASVPVQVNTLGLSNGQVVQANIGLMIANEQQTQVNFPVSMTVGNQSQLTANPANITFSAITGNSFGTPTSIPVTVSSSGQALTYNVTIATTTGGNWIGVTNTTNIPTNSSAAGFSVSVNAQNLAVGTYTGTITLQSTSTADSTIIPVTIQVTAGSALNVTPTTLNNFIFQAGSSTVPQQTQTLLISTNSGSLNYQIQPTATTTGGTNWLIISPGQGGLATTTPQQITLSLSYLGVASLPIGTYSINLAISPTASSGNTINIPVNLVVSNNALLSVNNSSLSFSIPFGSPTSQQQTVQVTSSNGSSIPYTVQTSASWLTTSITSGSTTANPVLGIFANATGQNVTSTPLQGTVTLFPANGDNYSIQIAVTLTVTSATTSLFAAPAALLFSYETTQPVPPSQLVQLSSPSTTGFTVSTTMQGASNCPSSTWLVATANGSSTPATISVNVLTTGMTAGFCSGQVIVTYNNGSGNATVNIPVFVDIAATPLLTITPDQNFGVVVANTGTNSVLQSRILMGSTDGTPVGYSAFASTPNTPGNIAWLSLGNSQGNTQQYMQVFVLPSGLPVGTYTGSITISATNSATLPSGQFVIPVVLTISANTTVTVSCGSSSACSSLTFTEAQGATTLPSSQTLTLTATGGSTPFTATVAPVTGGNWLHVDPPSGNASANITASILSNTLSVGTYTSNITLKFTNSATPTVTIPVSLVVTAAQTVTVAPTSLSFTYQLGGAAPSAQTLNVTSTGGAASIAAATTSSPAWLSVTPSNGQTGASGTALPLTVSVTTNVLTTAQTYNGTITITPTGQTAITVPVTLIVTQVSAPQPGTISNSASLTFGPIAPGELITIKGTNLGPGTAANFTVGSGGTLSNILGGVQVLFDTIPGTPIYVSSTQINVIVPYEIAGRSSTNVVVTYSGQQSAPIPQTVASQAPGIYTDSSSGAGQASVVNQNGTLNGPAAGLVIGGQNVATSPAGAGQVISVYMTGGGQTSPQSSTGTVTPGGTTLYKIPGNVTATINGVNAPVQFAGAAPGEVTGVIQLNITVPAGVSGSALPLAVTIGGSTSVAGPTVAVQ